MVTEVALQMLRGDVPVGKQTTQCLEFVAGQGWRVKTMIPPGGAEQTVRLVEQRQVELVVMPFVSQESLEIEARVMKAGGKVAYCRQPPERRPTVDTSDVIMHLYRKGHPVGELADILRATPERIRRTLRRHGIHNPNE
jgi:hypothetical protein